MNRYAHCGFSPLARAGVCFGKGGGSSGGTQTTTSKTELPQWVTNAGQSNYNFAQDVSANLAKPYEGQRVADMPAGLQQIINMLQGNIGSTNAGFEVGKSVAQGLTGFNPSMISPQTLAGTDLSPYMNPFTKSVIDPTMGLLEQQRKQSLNQVGDQAIQSKAFGGSRQGIAEGVASSQGDLAKAQFLGGLLGQNFGQAVSGATGDITRDLQAQGANQTAGLQGAQLRGSMAQLLGQLTGSQQQNWLQGIQAATGGQQALQQQDQAKLDAARQLYEEKKQYPIQQLQILQSALSNTPYGTSSTQTGPGPQTDPLMQGLGTASSLAGIAGTLLPLFGFSDRRMKTDITKLRKDAETGLNLYAYRYKGDPKSYPKVVGPMAQEVEKKFPHLVADIGGFKAVNANFLMGMAA